MARGDEPIVVAAVPVTMSGGRVIEEDGVRVEMLTAARYAEEFAVYSAFVSSKHCCCIFPLSMSESAAENAKKKGRWPEDKRSLGAVAVDLATDKVLGIVQGAGHGHPCDMHAPKRDEVYVEHLAVSAGARGKGVGTKLLRWVEAEARARGARTLSLAVIRGNPAQRLYERFGFETKREGCCDDAIGCCIVTWLMGRPYGLCHGRWGADTMYKALVDEPRRPA